MTVYNAIRKPLLLHPRRRFIPPMLFPPTMSWSAFSSNRFFSSWKKQTFRFVSFREPRRNRTSERPLFQGKGKGATIVPVTTAPLFRISDTRHFLPFLPSFLSFFPFRSFLLIVYANAENKRGTGRVIFGEGGIWIL